MDAAERMVATLNQAGRVLKQLRREIRADGDQFDRYVQETLNPWLVAQGGEPIDPIQWLADAPTD